MILTLPKIFNLKVQWCNWLVRLDLLAALMEYLKHEIESLMEPFSWIATHTQLFPTHFAMLQTKAKTHKSTRDMRLD